MATMFWVWLGIIVVSAIIEAVTMELVSVWFIAGAIPAFIMSACMGNYLWELQVALFIVISALLIIFLRKWTKNLLLKNANEKTNVDALVGKKLRMLERTDFETIGAVKVNDVVWTAVAEKDATIEKNEIVEVVKVEGNKLIVKPIEKEVKQASKENESKKTAEVKDKGDVK